MRNTTRTQWAAGFFALLGGFCAVAAAVRPELPASTGLDFWSIPGLAQEIREGEALERRVSDQLELTHERLIRKQQLYEAVIDGLPLADAVRAYRQIDPDLTSLRIQAESEKTPVRSDLELVVEAVLRGVRNRIGEMPAASRPYELLARLEAEARAGLGST
jgi:hypothetical protein